jgi:hypothetical protein
MAMKVSEILQSSADLNCMINRVINMAFRWQGVDCQDFVLMVVDTCRRTIPHLAWADHDANVIQGTRAGRSTIISCETDLNLFQMGNFFFPVKVYLCPSNFDCPSQATSFDGFILDLESRDLVEPVVVQVETMELLQLHQKLLEVRSYYYCHSETI